MSERAATWDFERGYPGGPMVKVRGFPRPLYPPSAAARGYKPSEPSSDVIGYKRTVSRCGRWPWQEFDDRFSDAFSLGAGANVVQSGVAGVQRQQKMNATGYIGIATFNALRSIRIPKGLPHAGEPAMDATAVQLINAAFDKYGGAPTPAAPGQLKRKAIPSPSYSSRGGASVRLIVLHTAEGARTIESLGNFFAKSANRVSSHVGIDDKPGVVGEYVKPSGKAWTAGNANPVAVQVELCAFARWSLQQWNEHPHMLENCARWIAEEAKRFGIPIQKLTPAQARGAGRGICQHADLGAWGGGHWDCGGSFPIDRVIKRAKEIAR